VKADPRTMPAASDLNHQKQSSNEAPNPSSVQVVDQPSRVPGWSIWLFRIRALLFVTLCATFGVLLLILPWTPKWTDNPLLLNAPGLRDVVSSGFVRGVASGLGVLDLWLGFWEAIHYHETPKATP
jgi:hypothetical protein